MTMWRTHSCVPCRHSCRHHQRGITLLEMLIVVTIIAIVAGLSFPSAASGLDSLRLRSASDSIVSLLNTSLDRADRRQQAVEIMILPRENAIVARSADLGFTRATSAVGELGNRIEVPPIFSSRPIRLNRRIQRWNVIFLMFPWWWVVAGFGCGLCG